LPELHGAEISLYDIDPERLETAGMMVRWTSHQLRAEARVEEHADRQSAVEGADFVVNMVQIGMHEATLLDFEIPKKYGLKQTIADSMGIGGIFRGLRTIPFVLDLAGEMGELCPRALLLNYTNPMSILMESLYTASPRQSPSDSATASLTPLSRISQSGRRWRVGRTTSITPLCSTAMLRASSRSTR
jgi:alpha-galactosidase